MTNQVNGRILPRALQFVDISSADLVKYRVQPGDLLFNRTNSFELVGRTAIFELNGNFVFASYLIRLRTVSSRLLPRFLNFYLNAEATQRRLKSIATRAVSQSNISATRLKGFAIPVPPVDEQRKIIAVLSAVQRAIERQERLIVLAGELKKAVMHRLFTEGTRGEPLKQTDIGPIPAIWSLKRCAELCYKVSVGVVVKPRSHYVKNGVPAIRSFNVREDRLIPNDLVYFSHAENDSVLSKSKLRAGDVLIVRTGYPGTSCVVPGEFDGSNCIDIIFARPGPDVESAYLSRFFNSDAGRTQAMVSTHGLAQQHLNVSAVKRVLVPVPNLDEQREIVECLAAVDKKIDAHEQSAVMLTNLFHTLRDQLMTGQVRVHDVALSELEAVEHEPAETGANVHQAD